MRTNIRQVRIPIFWPGYRSVGALELCGSASPWATVAQHLRGEERREGEAGRSSGSRPMDSLLSSYGFWNYLFKWNSLVQQKIKALIYFGVIFSNAILRCNQKTRPLWVLKWFVNGLLRSNKKTWPMLHLEMFVQMKFFGPTTKRGPYDFRNYFLKWNSSVQQKTQGPYDFWIKNFTWNSSVQQKNGAFMTFGIILPNGNIRSNKKAKPWRHFESVFKRKKCSNAILEICCNKTKFLMNFGEMLPLL